MSHTKPLRPVPLSHDRKRVILFLQGHPSVFWPQLGDALERDGHRILRVNLCLADWLFWGMRPGFNYRGRFAGWHEWLRALCNREAVTDILYYADRLPYHRVARVVGQELGLSCWAIEHGYFRPDWLTMEPDAMGSLSTFPRDRRAIAELAARVPEPDLTTRYRHPFSTEGFYEVCYNLLQAYGRPFYPFYFSDKIYWPAVDYLSWLVELALANRREKQAAEMSRRAEGGLDFNLIAMQLETDYQIRASSHYSSLEAFLDEVIGSFALHAPAPRELVIKLHPLDNGLKRWFAKIPRLAARHGIARRVHVIKGSDLNTFLIRSRGVVTVNSTVGLHALNAGVPCFASGQAIYKLPGLTHQGDLASFWNAPEAIDVPFYETFRRALTHTQIKGSFYNAEGRAAAIAEICQRLH